MPGYLEWRAAAIRLREFTIRELADEVGVSTQAVRYHLPLFNATGVAVPVGERPVPPKNVPATVYLCRRAYGRFVREVEVDAVQRIARGEPLPGRPRWRGLDPEVRDLVQTAEDLGWSVRRTRTGAHLAFFDPAGNYVSSVSANGGSDHRAVANAAAALRRGGLVAA